MNKGSSIQTTILDKLSDGRPHPREEILMCLEDETATYKNLWWHIFSLRKKMEPRGESIVCELNGRKIMYRHVRLLPSAANGVH